MIATLAEGYRKKKPHRLKRSQKIVIYSHQHTVEFELSLKGFNYETLKQQKIFNSFTVHQLL